MTTTPAATALSPRERQVLVGLAAGRTLAVIAADLGLGAGTVGGYLKLAKEKLRGREITSAIARGYATEAIPGPPLLDPKRVILPRGQRELVLLITTGMHAPQIAAELHLPLANVRDDVRELLTSVNALNRAHLITRAWQYQILTKELVCKWLP
ncbi:LuxR C-terminal-related transcriptional regulator [Streptomyces sp. NPDC058001]|uniref:LuxR C-terminal-related transcriptional regulator n=1 Tax=Streptomyces sp. NPDC058001 TaxID=3346300 RepID=UPI0036E4E710